jgi:hypothetical protein
VLPTGDSLPLPTGDSRIDIRLGKFTRASARLGRRRPTARTPALPQCTDQTPASAEGSPSLCAVAGIPGRSSSPDSPFRQSAACSLRGPSRRASLTPNCGVRTALVSSSSKKKFKTCAFLYGGTPMVMILKALEIMTGYRSPARTPALSSPRDTRRIASGGQIGIGTRSRPGGTCDAPWLRVGRLAHSPPRAPQGRPRHRKQTARAVHPAPPAPASGGQRRSRARRSCRGVHHVHVAARDGVVRKDRRE